MGKKDKLHRKKVQARNLKLKADEGIMQKMFNDAMKNQIEELKKKYESESGTTQNQEQ
jgi:hypothetical protein